MHNQPSLRIALLMHSVNPRGGVVHSMELAAALHARGHAVTLMAPATPQQKLFRDTPCAVELIPVPAVMGSTATVVGARIAAAVEYLVTRRALQRFDVWHAQDGSGANVLATLQQRGAITGFMRTVHHLDQFADAQLAAWQERSIRWPRQLLCVSRMWRDALKRDYGITAALVQNGVDVNRFSPQAQASDAGVAQRYGLRRGAPLIVAIGGVEARKNTLGLLQAFMRVRQQLPHAQLAIVGGASLLDHSQYRAKFNELVTSSGLTSGPHQPLVVTGTVPDADLPALLRLADAMAFPSLREGFGLVVLEALACGTPVVVSRIPPFTEYLAGAAAPNEMSHAVHWADPLQPEAIAQALLNAVATPKFAPPAVCQRFSWAASAAQHSALYRHFLASDSVPLPLSAELVR